MRAETETEVVHVGPTSTAAPADGLFGAAAPGCRVHVVGPDQARHRQAEGRPVGSHMFAESNCPTCRITLFTVHGPAGYRSSSHFHSEDEIIQVLSGALQVGPATVGAGMAVAIHGNERYGFTAVDDFVFLNYRRDVSTFTTTPGSKPLLEAEPPEGVTVAAAVL